MLALPDERRVDLAAQRTRLVDRLHARLRDLLAGGAPTQPSADRAAALRCGGRPAGVVERTRKDLARDVVAELPGVDARLEAGAARTAEVVAASGSRLTDVDGVGPVPTARLLGRTGGASRLPSGAHHASTAPIEVASAERARHRPSRSGDRPLDAALHLVAVTQARTARSAGHAYAQRRLAEGKTRNEAPRCLERRTAERLWRITLADERAHPSRPPDGEARRAAARRRDDGRGAGVELAGSSSWRIEVDEPQVLVVASFVRDAAGLRPEVDPANPPLEPAVAPGPGGSEGDAAAAASAQWAAWWPRLLERGAAALRDLEPPDFPALAGTPALQDLVRARFDDAVAWSGDRRREHAEFARDPRRNVEGDAVRAAERDLGRRARPFRLRVTELPVAGDGGWVFADDHVVVARALRRDPDAYRRWLRPVVARLA